MQQQETTRVLIIGGGPAGSTAAALLAKQNIEVIVLEQTYFPRYHIGESLVPSSLYALELSGAREKVEVHGFTRKEGGFLDWGSVKWRFHFTNLAGAHGDNHSFQVVRSEFDQILLEHARSQGATVREGVKVTNLVWEGKRPRTATWIEQDTGKQGEITFDYLIDASGRAGVVASFLGNRYYHEPFKNVALWGYWTNASSPDMQLDAPKGAIAICRVGHGWVWAIPLHDKTLSVGLVLHKEELKQKRESGLDLEQIYHQAVTASPDIAKLVKGATLASKLKTEQDYSYVAQSFSGPGYFLAGDAACFLDPLFSSGVHLATLSALIASASITSICKGEISEEEAQHFHHLSYEKAYRRFFALLVSFYQHHIGNEPYFREAMRLTRHCYQEAGMMAAFTQIVSGSEDLRDIEDPVELTSNKQRSSSVKEYYVPEAVDEKKTAKFQAQLHNSLELIAASTETAIDGMYVRAEPLGVGRI
jgi:flavin-dependent dehydrogenase